jgi:hypothetical protein
LEKAREKRYELLSNAARMHVFHPSQALPGARLNVRVDVESVFAGHNFPTGFMVERQVWIAITVRDPNGRPIFSSGDLDHNRELRNSHSHEVLTHKVRHDPHLFNLQSEFTGLTSKGTERPLVLPINRHLAPLNIFRPATEGALSFGRPSTFRIAKGSLPPLRTLGQTYPLRLAQLCGTYWVDVKLRFRNLPPSLLDHIGTPHLKDQLEIVELAEYRGAIQVDDQRNPIARLKRGFR